MSTANRSSGFRHNEATVVLQRGGEQAAAPLGAQGVRPAGCGHVPWSSDPYAAAAQLSLAYEGSRGASPQCIGQAFVVLAGPVGESVQRGPDGRRPERQRGEGTERCTAENVARVVGPERDAGDGHERREEERDDAAIAVAQQDGEGDRIGAGGVVGRERRVG